jgi:predicted flap endonuclease-1-like 5' DNA nuclease
MFKIRKTQNHEEESMSPLFTFVLGVLVGWLIEWLIDFYYWRRRTSEEIEMSARHEAIVSRTAALVSPETKTVEKPATDNLLIIKGIGPVIEQKLNEAGIFTFEQLGKLTAEDLRNILGNVIQRLANEESLLEQARELARKKQVKP